MIVYMQRVCIGHFAVMACGWAQPQAGREGTTAGRHVGVCHVEHEEDALADALVCIRGADPRLHHSSETANVSGSASVMGRSMCGLCLVVAAVVG
jgi:hypothetical protein